MLDAKSSQIKLGKLDINDGLGPKNLISLCVCEYEISLLFWQQTAERSEMTRR